MNTATQDFKVICDFIRDASTPFALINDNGKCIFENPALERLNIKKYLTDYFYTENGKETLHRASQQSNPTPFSFIGAQNRQKASIRRILPNAERIIFVVQLNQSERMAAFTMASNSEQAAALQNYQKRVASDRFEIFFKNGRDGKAILTRDGKFLHANPALLKLLNISLEQLHQKSFSDLVYEASFPASSQSQEFPISDLSKYIPSQFDATLRYEDKNIPVSVSLESNGSSKNLEIFLSLRDLTNSQRFAEVQKLNLELDKANKEMDEFNRLMSHEMRAPLSKLVSLAENLRGLNDLNQEVAKYISMMEEAAQDALLQYSAILSLSRSGKRQLTPLRLQELERRLLRQHSLFAEYHGVNLISNVDSDYNIDIPVDATDAFLIMTNLISNALKHTAAGNSVTFSIAASLEDQKLELQVQDTGAGISKELQPKIFEAFVTTAHKMDIQTGIGVGLSIVRRTVNNCKGEINFTSEIGRGTTFFVSLPFENHALSKVERENKDTSLDRLKIEPGGSVLVIDDDFVNLQILSARIKAAGYKPITANNGTEALKLLKACPDNFPKLIFIDRNMPGLNGMETARVIRNQHNDQEIFICGLTAYVDSDIEEEMQNAGINCVEQKPLSQDVLEKYLLSADN